MFVEKENHVKVYNSTRIFASVVVTFRYVNYNGLSSRYFPDVRRMESPNIVSTTNEKSP